MLEVLVHADAEDLIRDYYCIFKVDIPDDCLLELGIPLPADWQANPAPLSTKAIGDDWITSKASVVLGVPSAIVPAESIYLINPVHDDFSKLVIGPEQAIDFEPRLA